MINAKNTDIGIYISYKGETLSIARAPVYLEHVSALRAIKNARAL